MFANPDLILKHIVDIINAAPPGTFSVIIDTSDANDKRRSDAAIASARVIACRKVIEAVASNPSHPYWGLLSTLVTHTYGATIKPNYGEIGTPLIQPVESLNGNTDIPFLTGQSKDAGEIEGIVLNLFEKNPFDFFGSDVDSTGGDSYTSALAAEGRWPPNKNWYDTSDGVVIFTGFACKIPMIVIPTGANEAESLALEETYVIAHVPVNYTDTAARYALSMLIKEGDSLLPLANLMMQEAKAELFEAAGGKLTAKPLDFTRAIELAQKYQS